MNENCMSLEGKLRWSTLLNPFYMEERLSLYMQQSEKDAERMSPTQTHHLWSIIPIHDTINVGRR